MVKMKSQKKKQIFINKNLLVKNRKKMVSKKLIIILVTIALLLALVSIIINVSFLNMKKIPENGLNEPNENIIPDTESGKVSIIINPPNPR